MAEPLIYVEPPARKKRRGGILAVAGDPIIEPRLLGGSAGVHYTSEGCMLPSETRNGIFDTVPAADKDQLGGIDTEDGIGPAFASYAGVESYLEESTTDFERRAEKLLSEGIDRRLESKLWTWVNADAAPSAAATLVEAIAEAEQVADGTYVGDPVLVMSRRLLVLAADVAGAKWDGDAGYHRTASGTAIIASGAITVHSALGVTGWPTVYASPVRTTPTTHHVVNRQMAIAEQAHAITVDCLFRRKVTIAP